MRTATSKPVKWMALSALFLSGLACADALPFQEMALVRCAATTGDSGNEVTLDDVNFVDSNMENDVSVTRVGSDISDDPILAKNKPMSIFAGFHNKTDRRLYLEVQTIYKDKDGNALNKGSWLPLTLKPHEEKEYHSASLSMQAVDFLVRVRRAKSTSSPAHP